MSVMGAFFMNTLNSGEHLEEASGYQVPEFCLRHIFEYEQCPFTAISRLKFGGRPSIRGETDINFIVLS